MINTTKGFQIIKCQMSKTFILFTGYFRHTILNDYRCSVRIHKIAGPNTGPFGSAKTPLLTVQQPIGNVFLSTQQWMSAFSVLGYREE